MLIRNNAKRFPFQNEEFAIQLCRFLFRFHLGYFRVSRTLLGQCHWACVPP